jgi:acyl-coenzyme A thioesterase PaaI-like protein
MAQPIRPEDQQPSSKWCFVCGVENPCGLHIRFFNEGPQRCVALVTFDETYQSYPGMTHGGILATVLDETMGRATLAAQPEAEPRFMFTAKLEIRYRRPVPLRQEVVVRGWVEKDRGRMVEAGGEIVLSDGTVAVVASSTLVEVPPENVNQMKAEDVGWQVYP